MATTPDWVFTAAVLIRGRWSGGAPSQQPSGSLRCASAQTFEEHGWKCDLININPECTRSQKLSPED